MKRLFHWLIHRMGCTRNGIPVLWEARCGVLMRGDKCCCGTVINIRPHGEKLGGLKLALLFSLATLSGCTVVQERVIFKTLPPRIIERHFILVPEDAVPEESKKRIENNKEAQKFA